MPICRLVERPVSGTARGIGSRPLLAERGTVSALRSVGQESRSSL